MNPPLLSLVLVGLAVLCAVHGQRCPYGTLPGRYSENSASGDKWQILVNRCTLTNHLKSYATPSQSSSRTPSVSMLFIGDSTDNYLMQAVCGYTKGQITRSDPYPPIGFNLCSKNGPPSLIVGQVYSPSLTSIGLVNLPGYKPLQGFDAKVRLARSSMLNALNGKEPDVVVLGGGMWDIFRWTKGPVSELAPAEKSLRSTMEINPNLENYWRAQIKRAIGIVKRTFPKSRILWRAYVMPAWNLQTGAALNGNIGSRSLLAAAKAIGKAAALENGIEIVDMDRMVQAFFKADQYLIDLHHAKYPVYLEAVNTILNIHLNEAPLRAAKLQG